MPSIAKLNKQRSKRKARVRASIREFNRSDRKRICFHVTGKHLYAQIINDADGKTLLTVSTLDKSLRPAVGKSAKSKEFAKKLADLVIGKMQDKKLQPAEGYVFDRGARLYHGRVQVFADTLREKGVNF